MSWRGHIFWQYAETWPSYDEDQKATLWWVDMGANNSSMLTSAWQRGHKGDVELVDDAGYHCWTVDMTTMEQFSELSNTVRPVRRVRFLQAAEP